MATNFKFAQLQPFALSGAGASLGDTSITLQSMTDIDGNALSMSGTFGAKGYGTIEPGNGTLEEQIYFTGLANNANGTVTLSGVHSVGFTYPYTATSGLAKTHAGNTTFVISNTADFYDQFVAKDNDGNISEVLTFTVPNYPQVDDASTPPTEDVQFATKKYVDDTAVAGAPNATTSVKGIVQLGTQANVDAKTATGSTGASLVVTPDKMRSTLLSDYVADTGTSTAYAIAPTPAITAYSVGQTFSFKAAHSNTTTGPTLNVNSLGAKTITKIGTVSLAVGDIAAGAIVQVEYDGTNFQLTSLTGNVPISQNAAQIYAVDGGSANAYTATLSPPLGGYTAGLIVNLTISNSSTGASTLNVSGLGAKTIKKLNGTTDVTKNDLLAGSTYQFIYDGTNFVTEVPTQSSNGTLSIASNSGANVITTGFKPRIIRFAWQYKSSNTGTALPLTGYGTYINGTSAEVYSTNTGGSSGGSTVAVNSNTSIISGEAASDQGTFSGAVGTLTDTGFTLTMTNATGATPTVVIAWEAAT